MKVGLVLEGGAMRGLYTAGVLDVFLDENIEVDTMIGVSAGAVFGINYLSHQKGRVLRYNKKYAGDKRYMSFTSLLKTGDIVNKDFTYYEMPSKLDIFDEKEFEKSKTKFYATVTNLETGKAEYIRITDAFKQLEYLRASASMPLVSNIVEIGNQKYLDGAVADSIPIDKIIEMGCDKIIVVLTKPKGYRKRKSTNSLMTARYKEYPKFRRAFNNRYKNYNESLDKIAKLESEGKIFVLRPSEKVKVKRIEKNANRLEKMYKLGVKDAKNKMSSLKKYLSSDKELVK